MTERVNMTEVDPALSSSSSGLQENKMPSISASTGADSNTQRADSMVQASACNRKRKAGGGRSCRADLSAFGWRSARVKDGRAMLERTDVKTILRRIRDQDRNYTVVLKVKDSMSASINTVVMDEIIKALRKNRVCQLLYVQNLDDAITDVQLRALMECLKKRKNIWALNIGETYKVTNKGWEYFCKVLPETHITHLYVSEHVIDLNLKNKMREHIRNNRKKHARHCSLRNLSVIERCTNMWWNPINHIRHMLDAKWQREHAPPPASEPERKKRETHVVDPSLLTPNHTAYWAEGYGKFVGGAGAEKPWKFKCVCGETCSSYEKWIFHPTGRQFECTHCGIWGHVDHVLGGHVTDEDLEELEEVLCNACKSGKRREKLAELKELGIRYPFAADGKCLVELDNSCVMEDDALGEQDNDEVSDTEEEDGGEEEKEEKEDEGEDTGEDEGEEKPTRRKRGGSEGG